MFYAILGSINNICIFAATKRYSIWQRQKTGISVCSQTPQKMKANGMPTAIILEMTGLSASLLR